MHVRGRAVGAAGIPVWAGYAGPPDSNGLGVPVTSRSCLAAHRTAAYRSVANRASTRRSAGRLTATNGPGRSGDPRRARYPLGG